MTWYLYILIFALGILLLFLTWAILPARSGPPMKKLNRYFGFVLRYPQRLLIVFAGNITLLLLTGSEALLDFLYGYWYIWAWGLLGIATRWSIDLYVDMVKHGYDPTKDLPKTDWWGIQLLSDMATFISILGIIVSLLFLLVIDIISFIHLAVSI